jgi:hypothetical protein
MERVLHACEFEEGFPVGPFFGKRQIAEANLDPLDPAVVVDAGIVHVSQILRPRDRPSPQTAVLDGPEKLDFLPRLTPEALKANQALIDLLGSIAARKKATPVQAALAWLLAQKPWIVPIPGTTKLHRLDENIGAADVELTADDLREIESAASKITVQGARYPEKLEKMTGPWVEIKTNILGKRRLSSFPLFSLKAASKARVRLP